MEPLFLAVICGCNAGLFHEALREVYVPRIQRGDAFFAAKVLGARGALLSVLVHFFERGRWEAPVETGVGDHSLTAEDQLFVIMQAALYLTATRGSAAPEVLSCYERAEPLCHLLNRPLLLYVTLIGKWRYSLNTDSMTRTMQIAERIYLLAQKQNNSALIMGACRPLACTFYFLGNFEFACQHATKGVEIWRAGAAPSLVEEPIPPAVSCLCFKAVAEWHLGEMASCNSTIAEAISLANALHDTHAQATALWYAAAAAHFERNPAKVESLVAVLIEVSTRYSFAYWLAGGTILRGWARSVSGDAMEGLTLIKAGIQGRRSTGSILTMPFALALRAEALHLTDRTLEALESVREAEELVERYEERWWLAELRRLRGVFLVNIGADETQIETSFCGAIKTAREQNSISLAKRAEGTYAEYRRQKASGLGGRGFRLPLC
jgi:predicted ATPase